MTDLNTIDDLDVIDPDDIPDPRDIVNGRIFTINNCDAPICLEITSQVLDALKCRAHDLNIPNTSDEANGLFVSEVEHFVSFVQLNFPFELSIMAVNIILRDFDMPPSEIAPSPILHAFVAQYSDFF